MKIRIMNIEDFKKIYDLWINTEGMGLNTTDDSAMKALGAEGIHKVALVAFESNVGFVK